MLFSLFSLWDGLNDSLKRSVKLSCLGFYYSKSSNIFFYGTLISVIYATLLNDVVVFMLREMVLILISVVHYRYHPEIRTILEEDQIMLKLLKQEHCIIKFDFALACAMFFSVIVYAFWPYFGPWGYILYGYVSVPYLFFYSCYRTYYVYSIYTTPAVRKYLDVRGSIRRHGLRSFSTSSAVFHTAKTWFSYGLYAVTGTVVGPKLMHGDLMYRGDLVNEIVYRDIGVRTRNDVLGMQAAYYLQHYPEDYHKITGKDGWVKPVILKELSDERKCHFFLYKHTTTLEHRFPMLSLPSWPNSKK